MRAGNFTGIKGFPNQDLAMWTSLGPIADRTSKGEILAAGDLAVVEFRRVMLEAVRAFQAGGTAIGTGGDHVDTSVCSFQGIFAKKTDWRTCEVHPVTGDEAM
jgi:phthalate 4,5-dioxygenase oxygenase subunit